VAEAAALHFQAVRELPGASAMCQNPECKVLLGNFLMGPGCVVAFVCSRCGGVSRFEITSGRIQVGYAQPPANRSLTRAKSPP